MLELSGADELPGFSYCYPHRWVYYILMETMPLPVKHQSDADAVLAKRIRLIVMQFGGLGSFFDRLHSNKKVRESCAPGTDQVFPGPLTEIGKTDHGADD
jgi:hypothetical protein